jgi:predicted ATPase
MRTGLDDFEKTGAGLRLPYYLSLLADGQGRNGQPEKALATVDLALQRANTNGEKWHNADLFRLRAQILLQMNSGNTSDAETAFQGALNISREQGCKARELQITTELGRLWQSQGKHRDAHDLVAPIYSCFPNSSESVYLKNAKALLEESW